MKVTADQMATLRAFLVDDLEQYDRLMERLDQTAGLDGYRVLLAAAFFEAVNRRFRGCSIADIVRFVAAARARYGTHADEIDPLAAERLIQAVLTADSGIHLDDKTKALQVLLLRELIADERLNDAELDEFLAQARRRAESLPLG